MEKTKEKEKQSFPASGCGTDRNLFAFAGTWEEYEDESAWHFIHFQLK